MMISYLCMDLFKKSGKTFKCITTNIIHFYAYRYLLYACLQEKIYCDS